MKPKVLRRFIKRHLSYHGSVPYEQLLKAVWQQNTHTRVKAINRALLKMVRWEQIRVNRSAGGAIHYEL